MNSRSTLIISVFFLSILCISFASSLCTSCYRAINVCTVSDLDAIRTNLNANYVQVCNINLTGTSFSPVGALGNPFSGSYNGKGYTISGFTYSNASGISVGLFAANNGTIANVRLQNVNVSGRVTVGGLVGTNTGIITNSSVLSGVVYPRGFDSRHIGGLAGFNGNFNGVYTSYTGRIQNSYSNATVGNLNTFYSGGLVGVNEYGATIVNSSSSGDVYAQGNAGGLVGTSAGKIDHSYATGNVYGGETSKHGCLSFNPNPCVEIGGLLGLNTINGIVNNSYATGAVRGYDEIGGLVGKTFSISSVENSYATGSVYGHEAIGGLLGTYSSGQIQGIYHFPLVYNSYSTGTVNGWGDPLYLGGLVGFDFHNDGRVTSCYWDTETSGQSTSVLGSGKTTSEMHNQSMYVGWDFVKVWFINNGLDYPHIR